MCYIFLKEWGSRISNMTFPCDMVDMDMVDMDMADMDNDNRDNNNETTMK